MMASCEEFALLMSQSLDGELSYEEELLLQDHLQGCPACRELFQELSELQASFSSMTLSPPPSLHARIMEQIKQEATNLTASQANDNRIRPVKGYRRYATTAAALVILVSAVVFGANKLCPPHPVEGLSGGADSAVAAPEPNQRALPENTAPVEPSTYQAEPKKPAAYQGSSQKPVKPSAASLPEPPQTAMPPKSITEPPSAPLTEFTTKELPLTMTVLSQSDAEALLIQKLTEEGQIDPKPIFSRQQEEDYLFLYTDSQGVSWVYSVSSRDGSIDGTSSPSDPLSTYY